MARRPQNAWAVPFGCPDWLFLPLTPLGLPGLVLPAASAAAYFAVIQINFAFARSASPSGGEAAAPHSASPGGGGSPPLQRLGGAGCGATV